MNKDPVSRRTFLKAGVAVSGLLAATGGLHPPSVQAQDGGEMDMDTFLEEWEQAGKALMLVTEDEEIFASTFEAYLERDVERFQELLPNFPEFDLPEYPDFCDVICYKLYCRLERVWRCWRICYPLEVAQEFDFEHLRMIAQAEAQIWSDRELMERVLTATEQGEDETVSEVIREIADVYIPEDLPLEFVEPLRHTFCNEICFWTYEYVCFPICEFFCIPF